MDTKVHFRLSGFTVKVVEDRERAGGGGSMENPYFSRCWEDRRVLEFFGTVERPCSGRYFAEPELSAYDLRDGADEGVLHHEKIVIAATYPEIKQVSSTRLVYPDTISVQGQRRGFSALLLGLVWGQAIAGAVLRLAAAGARPWALREMRRVARAQREADDIGFKREPLDNFVILDVSSGRASNDNGEAVAILRGVAVYQCADPEDLPDSRNDAPVTAERVLHVGASRERDEVVVACPRRQHC